MVTCFWLAKWSAKCRYWELGSVWAGEWVCCFGVGGGGRDGRLVLC